VGGAADRGRTPITAYVSIGGNRIHPFPRSALWASHDTAKQRVGTSTWPRPGSQTWPQGGDSFMVTDTWGGQACGELPGQQW
jgi:hypothetical protein